MSPPCEHSLLADGMGSVWRNSMMGSLAVLIVSCEQTTVDIKLINKGRCFCQLIYDEVAEEVPEIKRPEEKCLRCVASMGRHHGHTCSFPCHL